MGAWKLVGGVAPGLAQGVELNPRLFVELVTLAHRVVAGVLSEGLVEPQVIPPLHRHEVAEPHVRHFVKDDKRAPDIHRLRDLAAIDGEVFIEGDAASVLHRTRIELWHDNLVVLLKRIGGVEGLLEERKTIFGVAEHVRCFKVLHHGVAAEDSERNGAELTGVGVLNLVVRTTNERGDVGRHALRGGECPKRETIAHRSWGGRWRIRNHKPV